MNENSKKNRPKSQIMLPNSTSPLPSHGRKNGSSDSLPNHRYENEWEVRSKELAEAKCRVAQMEKTMRWWSDCTDNWRKKWSEVKTERNDLRKELRITRSQLEKLMKQMASQRSHHDVTISSTDPPPTDQGSSKVNGFAIYSNMPMSTGPVSNHNPFHTQTFGSILSKKNAQTQTLALNTGQLSVIDKEIVSLLEEKVAHLTQKLDEVSRRLTTERDEKSRLELTVERLRRDLSDLHELYDSLKKELSDINGKEFTESEVESYADEEHETEEEARLINQLAQDGDDAEELEDDDDFDADIETELDKHTPTADVLSTELITNSTSRDEKDQNEIAVQEQTESLCKNPNAQKTEIVKHDLASSIQVEISEVHKKLDLKTFINDVTELVGSDTADKRLIWNDEKKVTIGELSEVDLDETKVTQVDNRQATEATIDESESNSKSNS